MRREDTYGDYLRRCRIARVEPQCFNMWLTYQLVAEAEVRAARVHLYSLVRRSRLEENLECIAQLRRDQQHEVA